MDNSVSVIVASHKEYKMPSDKLYKPVLVGVNYNKKIIPDGFTGDNIGDNISELNPFFCELTGLYWAWKNLDSDYIGLVHYRRYFSYSRKFDFEKLLTYDEIEKYLGRIKVFVPKKRKYYIESLYSHYAHTFDSSHLDCARQIISEKYPEYIKSFDIAVNKRYGYMFNMMIMKKELLNDYCEWLFDILFELRNRIDESEMDAFNLRYPGRVSERLFNVWLDYAVTTGKISKSEIAEIPVVSSEKTNWINKGTEFLKAKFLGKKYSKSF